MFGAGVSLYVTVCGLSAPMRALSPCNVRSFDRTKSCYDSSASVVVRVVDVCPCQYPSNAYSNKRWVSRPVLWCMECCNPSFCAEM